MRRWTDKQRPLRVGPGAHLLLAVIVFMLFPRLTHGRGQETKIPAEGLIRVEVRLKAGNIRLMAWNDDVATVSWEGGEHRIPVVKDGGVLKVGTGAERGPHAAMRDVLILLPEKVRVDVEGTLGDVEVQGFTGGVRVDILHGKVRVAACSSGVDVKTVTGDIVVQDVKGDIVLKTVSGTITGRNLKSTLIETKSVAGDQDLSRSQTRQLRMNSHSGNLRFGGGTGKEAMFEASSFSGDIEIALGPKEAFDLQAKSRQGRISTGAGIAVTERTENHVRGVANKGGASVKLTTYSGNIRVSVAAKGGTPSAKKGSHP